MLSQGKPPKPCSQIGGANIVENETATRYNSMVFEFKRRSVAGLHLQTSYALGRAMQIPPSRMVALVDELEREGLLERRPSPADRRAHALHVTGDGRRLLDRLMQVSAEHEAQLCAGLTQAERHRLIDLLSRVAAEQGLPTGVHPGVAATNADDKP